MNQSYEQTTIDYFLEEEPKAEPKDNVIDFPLHLPKFPIEESKQEIECPKVDVATKKEFQIVSDKAFESYESVMKQGNFERIPFSTYENIIHNLHHNGKQIKFTKASSIFGLFSYFVFKMQKNRSKELSKQNPKMFDHYECSVYGNKSDICKEIGIDGRTFDDYVEILIENGYICRMIGTEFSIQPKYYWFVFLEPNPTFTKENSKKIKRPKGENNIKNFKK